ncbi:MAG: DUF3857 domain-containing protein [Bacteroidales bacterium]|nr:DUF3857 domain-containing protein [Bacteroidales bacterium]MBR1850721.1 DUF3857 domain-containing protein [Bacteroidales bacterium]
MKHAITATILVAVLSVAAVHNKAIAQQPDAIYKTVKHEWIVTSDTTSDYHYRHEIKILRNRALTGYADKGETFVTYNPAIEQLQINEVYTLRADGSKVEMPQNAFIEQLPSNCTDCGRFNQLREMVMVHTGMEYNCIVVVDYTLHRKYGLVNQTLNLIKDCPIENLEVNISVPSTQELNVKMNNPGYLTFTPTVKSGTTSYSLKAKDVPQSYVDSYLPPYDQLYPTLHFYNGVAQFTPDFNQEGLPEAEQTINRLLNSSNPATNITAIGNFVVSNIHLNDIAPSMLGYTHATAQEVWQSVCGTATDKAVLLSALLNQYGYNAHVSGNHSDKVSVMIDTMEYVFDIRKRNSLMLNGEAKDEVVDIKETITDTARLDTITEGFYRYIIPAIKGEPSVKATNLAITRTAPLMGQACHIEQTLTVVLPKGVKLVGKAIDRSSSSPNIGASSIKIKQSGKKLIIERTLNIEKSIITAEDYKAYRNVITNWQSLDTLLLHTK